MSDKIEKLKALVLDGEHMSQVQAIYFAPTMIKLIAVFNSAVVCQRASATVYDYSKCSKEELIELLQEVKRSNAAILGEVINEFNESKGV